MDLWNFECDKVTLKNWMVKHEEVGHKQKRRGTRAKAHSSPRYLQTPTLLTHSKYKTEKLSADDLANELHTMCSASLLSPLSKVVHNVYLYSAVYVQLMSVSEAAQLV